MRTITAVILCVYAMAATAAVAADNDAALTVQTTEYEVQIGNATPGQNVALLGVTLGIGSRLSRFAKILADDDGDGRVSFAPGGLIPFTAVWVAVDVESGRHAIGGSRGYDARLRPFPSERLKKGADGAIVGLEQSRVEVDVLVVRSGEGAWLLHAIEGAGGDDDGHRNGILGLTYGAAQPLLPSYGEAPKSLKKRDFVAVIDPIHLDVFFSTTD